MSQGLMLGCGTNLLEGLGLVTHIKGFLQLENE